ncbi:MAG: acyl-CoA thioesterase [Candidatus Omnitrophica bacterium]|nr:acyl-CoA thioesterase [Candidatus Omnitrophota bacterium]
MDAKKVADSRTEMSQLMMPHHANPGGTVYGGTILSIADSVAYVCAARHAGPGCVTVSVDKVDFHEPIHIGEVVTFRASVNYVGRSSMEVGIHITAEDLKSGTKRHTNSCYFTMVAVDAQGKAVEVPRLIPETEDEKRRYAAGEARRRAARAQIRS